MFFFRLTEINLSPTDFYPSGHYSPLRQLVMYPPSFMQEHPSLLTHSAMVQSKAAMPISLATSMLIITVAWPKDGHMGLSTVPTSLLACLESLLMLVHRKDPFLVKRISKKISYPMGCFTPSHLKQVYTLVNFCWFFCRFICPLELGTEYSLKGIKITMLDANHCPGAALIHFRLPNGQCYLHTGDFRASKLMQSYPVLASQRINILYLDTTYCNPKYRCNSLSSMSWTCRLQLCQMLISCRYLFQVSFKRRCFGICCRRHEKIFE